MDKQFDELSKSLAEGVSRREALRKFGIGERLWELIHRWQRALSIAQKYPSTPVTYPHPIV